MSSPLGTSDFFALEAGDCLDRLELLAGEPSGPPADEFLRYARALRGSALMANQQPIARAAAGLEALARAYREQRRAWDAGTREQVLQAVEEFRVLVRRVREWTDDDDRRAGRVGVNLESLAGRKIGPAGRELRRASDSGMLNTGVRAFVAREGALIASALDRAARSLRIEPEAREPLYTVLRRMQSLRGLAELAELPPLPEILDGLELAIGDLTRLYAAPPGVDEVLDAGAQALTRVSREVADQGRPTPDADEARRFTDLLLRAFAAEQDVVPIESLYIDGDTDPVRPGGLRPAFDAPSALGPIELLSHGEHLCQTADLIENASTRTERDLRLYGLVSALRTLATGGKSALSSGVVAFANAARESIAQGTATAAVSTFATALREVGGLLRSSPGPQDAADLSARLVAVAERLRSAAPSEPPVGEAEPAAPPEVPIQALAYPEEPLIVKWGTPPVAEQAAPVPIETLAPDSPIADEPDEGGLEASFVTYARLVAERGLGPASLDELLGAPARAPGPPEPAPPSTMEPQEHEPAIVDIGELCFRGRRALERAAAVRDEVASRLADGVELGSVRPLIDELLDLVPLALDGGR